jgi:DNA-binding FadR family transcriptional regulator
MEAAHKAHTRLYDLVAGGKATKAQAHWDEHMRAIGQWMLDGRESETLIELFE